MSLAFILIPLAHSADPGEVTIRSGIYYPQPPAISAESNLVDSAVTVHNPQGHLSGGLSVADFVITDNGKPQAITFFSELRRPAAPTASTNSHTPTTVSASPGPATHQARSVALFFDDLHLSAVRLQESVLAARKLIGAGLPSDERMGIFTDSGTVTLDITNDTAALLAALLRIKSHSDQGDHGIAACPTLTPYSSFVIAERIDFPLRERAVLEVMSSRCDAVDRKTAEGLVQDRAESVWENSRQGSTAALDILKLLVAHLAKLEGNRILVLISDGFIDDGRMKNEKSAIFDDALRAHVVINSLSTAGIGLNFAQLILTNTMEDAAAATGGRLIKNTNDLAGALTDLSAAPEVSYLVGFQAGEPDGKYHDLKIRLTGHSGFKVESRPGYFASISAGKKDTVQQRIDSTVLSNAVIRDVPATVRIKTVPMANGGYQVTVAVDIDAKRIKFAAEGGVSLQQLMFVTAILDGRGDFVTGKQAVMDLRIKPATLASMQATGIHAVETFSLAKGAYTVREVVRELVQNQLAASTTPLELR